MLDVLSTTEQVIDALDGVNAVAALTGSNYKAVFNWKSFPKFPSKTYLVMTDELERRGKRAPTVCADQLASQGHHPT